MMYFWNTHFLAVMEFLNIRPKQNVGCGLIGKYIFNVVLCLVLLCIVVIVYADW